VKPPPEVVVPETSSAPLVLPLEQQDLFREILIELESRGVSFAVAGAFAMQQHTGICRDTKDLDLFLTAENAIQALEHLRLAGFECEIYDPVWLLKAHRGEFYVDLITGMSNAVIVVDESWIERSIPAVVHGLSTRVLAGEELLVSKLFIARRERFDGVDVAHIIHGTRGRIDWQRVLQLIGEHWEMLLWALVLFRYSYPAQTYYVPAELWEDLLTRFHQAISNPDPKAKFRGSLVDDKMFAIDVNEWGMENLMNEYRQRRLRSLPTIK
jgi:predicted nucleotidyltransferase